MRIDSSHQHRQFAGSRVCDPLVLHLCPCTLINIIIIAGGDHIRQGWTVDTARDRFTACSLGSLVVRYRGMMCIQYIQGMHTYKRGTELSIQQDAIQHVVLGTPFTMAMSLSQALGAPARWLTLVPVPWPCPEPTPIRLIIPFLPLDSPPHCSCTATQLDRPRESQPAHPSSYVDPGLLEP